MLPRGGTVVAFCERILALGRWNLQMSWCQSPGVPQGQPPGMAADKCIKEDLTSVKQNRVLSHFQFAERFYVNTIYCEQFHESIWSRLEEHLSS